MNTYALNVRLSDTVKHEMDALLETGAYNNESDLVAEAVHRLATQRDMSHAASLDDIDHHILRAVVRYYAQQPVSNVEDGLAEQAIAPLADAQSRYNVVMAHYLAGAISLARAAELLSLSSFELRERCLRLEVPLRTAPANLAEAQADVEAIKPWLTTSSP